MKQTFQVIKGFSRDYSEIRQVFKGPRGYKGLLHLIQVERAFGYCPDILKENGQKSCQTDYISHL